MENKKVESTHGTPPATGIASFRSTTTTCNIPLISIDVKQHFVSSNNSLCVSACDILILYLLVIRIIQIIIILKNIVIICWNNDIWNNYKYYNTKTNICSICFALFKTFVRDAERLGLYWYFCNRSTDI